MKTNSSVLSGKFWLAAVSVALFLLPVTAAAQAANSGSDRRGSINRGRVGVVTIVEPGETLDLNAKLKIRSGGFFLGNTALLRGGRGNRVIASSPPFAAVVLGTTDASDYLVFNAGGAERARISTDGNFGIGTMSPINAGNNARWLTIDGLSTYSGGVVYSVAGTAKGYTYYDDGMNAMGVQSASGVGVALKIGGSAALFVNPSGNVGIGTTTPAVKLAVQNSSSFTGTSGIAGSNATADLYNDTAAAIGEGAMLTFSSNYSGGKTTRAAIKGGSEQVSWDASGYLAFYVNRPPQINTLDEMMRITTAGSVGIGTTSPRTNYKLDVSGATSFGQATEKVNISSARVSFNRDQYSGVMTDTTVGGADLYNNAGDLTFETFNTSGTLVSTALVIKNSGNVGIGITDPGYTLDVGGQVRSRTGGFRFPDGTVQTTAASSGGSSQWSGSGPIYYNGNVGIGTSSPIGLLHVKASTNDNIWVGGHYNLSDGVTLYAGTETGNAVKGMEFGASSYYFAGGNVGIGTTSPTAKLHVFGGSGSSRLLVLGEGAGTGLRNLSLGYDYNNDYGWIQSIHDQSSYTPFVLQSSGGNVGIGTTTPGEKLDVSGTFRATGQNASPSSGAGVEISYASNTGYIQSYNRSAGSNAALYISGNTIQLNADGQGTVGIGSASHASQLDVTGNINVTGTGNINATGTIEANNIKAKYQDVAEWVQSSEQLAAGTVVVLDSTTSNQVTSSSVSYDTRVAGVISSQPGIALGEKSDSKVLVATTGRVKVKVDASKGPIHIGDLLVTSDIPGVAMKSEPVEFAGRKMHMPGTLIGKALEPLTVGKGEILVLLSLQ